MGSTVFDQRSGPLPDGARGRLSEYDPDAFSKILSYWSVLHDAAGYIDYNRQLADTGEFGARPGVPKSEAQRYCGSHFLGPDSDPWIWGCEPWSATFISFVMLNTGLGEAEFPRRGAHREYVDGLLRIAEQHPGRATFIPREIAEYTPVPGDLICADRSHGSRIDTVAARKQELRQGNAPERPMHCDIVVGPGAGSSEVVAVGGNVGQTVAASRFALDPSRRLQRNARHFFVVFQNRIGLLSPTT